MKSKLLPHKRLIMALCIVAIAAFSTCGKKDKDGDEPQNPLNLTGPEALIGGWDGVYNALDKNGDADGDVKPATLTFTDDGKFSIQLTSDTSAKASGTWQEFEGKSLFVTVLTSSISRIVVRSTIQELSYERTGTSLHVKSPSFELRLSRKTTSVAPNSSNGTSGSFPGLWSCSQDGLTTRLSIATNYNWRATMTESNGSYSALAGTGQIAAPGMLNLTITSSSHAVRPNSFLILAADGNDTILQMSVSGVAKPLGRCVR